MTINTEKLIEMGGNEWKKGPHHRIYFNSADDLIGLEVNHYGTGNISSATLKGEKISNSKARKISGVKIYYDVNAGAWVGPEEVVEKINLA